MHGPYSFGARVTCLLVLMALVILVDLARNHSNATRHREYGFILLAGVVAALVGFVNDLITSSISPEFFVYGKGLAAGNGLRLQAGLASRRDSPRERLGALFVFLLPPN